MPVSAHSYIAYNVLNSKPKWFFCLCVCMCVCLQRTEVDYNWKTLRSGHRCRFSICISSLNKRKSSPSASGGALINVLCLRLCVRVCKIIMCAVASIVSQSTWFKMCPMYNYRWVIQYASDIVYAVMMLPDYYQFCHNAGAVKALEYMECVCVCPLNPIEFVVS